MPGVTGYEKAGERVYAAFGEIMLRLSPPGNERLLQSPGLQATFGGGESNVLASLAIHGLSARFLSVLPDNDLGRAALRNLRGYGVDVSMVSLRKGARMGVYFMEKGASQRPSRVIYDRAHSAISEIAPGDIDWRAALAGCGWFHITGITPALSRGAADESLRAIEAARASGCTVSCDLNYRAALWNYGASARDVMPRLAALADVIIANEEDCQKALGIGTALDPSGGKLDHARYGELAAEVIGAYPNVRLAAITLRESVSASHNRWGACVSDGKGAFFSRTYDISPIVDRVGGGDSFAAGLIFGLSMLGTREEALEYAVAASCLAHSIEGDVNLASPAEIRALLEGDASGRIKR
ncbi:MAG: sugar kinase [Spirochaetes bacterium]|nr:MAG: sugar kinase [Spirochaetota bacterium]